MMFTEQSNIRLEKGTKIKLKKLARDGENESDIIRRYIQEGMRRDYKRSHRKKAS